MCSSTQPTPSSTQCSAAAWSRQWCRRNQKDKPGMCRQGEAISCEKGSPVQLCPKGMLKVDGRAGKSGLRGSRFSRRTRAATFAWPGRLHLQRVVKAIEIVEKSNRTQQLNNLTFRIEPAEFGKLFVAQR